MNCKRNAEYFFKHFNFDILYEQANKYIYSRKKKIDYLLNKYSEYYK